MNEKTTFLALIWFASLFSGVVGVADKPVELFDQGHGQMFLADRSEDLGRNLVNWLAGE